jgi:hypothetical protein
VSKGTTVIYIPLSVIKSVHEQTHSAMPDAPLRPYVPKRHPVRDAVRRWRNRNATSTAPAPSLQLVSAEQDADLCQAEVRDRGTAPEGVARAS